MKFLSQELQLHHATAQVRLLTILQHRIDRDKDLLLSRTRRVTFCNEKVLRFTVAVLVVEDTGCRLLIATSSPTLLNVTLDTLWRLKMDYKADILLVNTHTECDRSDYDLDFVLHPFALNFLPLLIRKIRMVIVTFDLMVSSEAFCKSFAVFSRDAVDDSALVF